MSMTLDPEILFPESLDSDTPSTLTSEHRHVGQSNQPNQTTEQPHEQPTMDALSIVARTAVDVDMVGKCQMCHKIVPIMSKHCGFYSITVPNPEPMTRAEVLRSFLKMLHTTVPSTEEDAVLALAGSNPAFNRAARLTCARLKRIEEVDVETDHK